MISFKKSRTASFAIIVAIYILAAILGIIVYKKNGFDEYERQTRFLLPVKK